MSFSSPDGQRGACPGPAPKTAAGQAQLIVLGVGEFCGVSDPTTPYFSVLFQHSRTGNTLQLLVTEAQASDLTAFLVREGISKPRVESVRAHQVVQDTAPPREMGLEEELCPFDVVDSLEGPV